MNIPVVLKALRPLGGESKPVYAVGVKGWGESGHFFSRGWVYAYMRPHGRCQKYEHPLDPTSDVNSNSARFLACYTSMWHTVPTF